MSRKKPSAKDASSALFGEAFETPTNILKDEVHDLIIARNHIQNAIAVSKDPALTASLKLSVLHIEQVLDKTLERDGQLRGLATDGLTGLPRRPVFDAKIETLVQQGRSFTVAAFDIDRFKSVNDTYGHLTGDKVLRAVGHILKDNMREGDLASRWGGEEFFVILPDTDIDLAKNITNRVRMIVEAYEHPDGKDNVPKVTISGGIKEYRGEPIEVFLKDLDTALYAAKENGRNRVEVAASKAVKPVVSSAPQL